MSKKLFFIISFVLLTALGGPALAADKSWTNGSGDGLWTTASNWSPSGVPVAGLDKAKLVKLPGPLISAGMAAECQWLVIGDYASGALSMTGGTLDVSGTPDSWTIVAYGPTDVGTFTMDGGAVTTANRVFVGFQGQGTLNMNGGTFDIGGTFGIGYCDSNATTGQGYVYLNGGTITAADFQMRHPTGVIGTLDITDGTLILEGDQTTAINTYVGNGWIIAFGGDGTVIRDYGVTNPDKTTVTAYVDTAKAGTPNPANGIDDVLPNATLSWTAGIGAISHDVYFGTSDPPAFMGNQLETTFDPCVLDFNTPYYWRIDEVNGLDTVTGDPWTFTTVSGLAYGSNPTDGISNVPLNKVLSWDAGYGAVSHDVYFGTDAPGVEAAERLTGDLDGNGQVDYDDLFILLDDYWLADPAGSEPYAGVNDDDIVDLTDYTLLAENYKGQPSPWFKGNTTSTSYDDPCDFELETTYYWRVDEVNGPVKLKGDLWSFTTTASDSNYSLVGKVMCGYQGWFNCPGDGIPRGWVHWGTYAGGGTFTPTECTVDMWPDMTEMGPGEKFIASAFYDGTDHYVFSSHNYDTVVRHFQWMDDYGIDGVYLQRFATETTPGTPWCNHRNDVLDYCKAGANLYGKKYAVMYDLSGLSSGSGGTLRVINDWKYLVDEKQVGRDPADQGYMFHNGQPVVAVWGLGFNRSYEGQESYDLIDFLKNDPTYGGNVVMLGVNNDWRTNPDTWFQQTLQLADIISPWWVGRFGNTGEAYNFASTVGVPDKAWCDTNGKEYLPVIFPGFSWYNMHSGGTPFNHIPRNGGQFLWDQVYSHINTVGATMLYVAMFDEVDEGTAIFKVTNNPPVAPPAMFVTYDIDGYPLPSDEYLWLVGQATRALRGEIPANQTRPAR